MFKSILIFAVLMTAYLTTAQEINDKLDIVGMKSPRYCDKWRPCAQGEQCCVKKKNFWHRCCPDNLECCYWYEPKCCEKKVNLLGQTELRIVPENEIYLHL